MANFHVGRVLPKAKSDFIGLNKVSYCTANLDFHSFIFIQPKVDLFSSNNDMLS